MLVSWSENEGQCTTSKRLIINISPRHHHHHASSSSLAPLPAPAHSDRAAPRLPHPPLQPRVPSPPPPEYLPSLPSLPRSRSAFHMLHQLASSPSLLGRRPRFPRRCPSLRHLAPRLRLPSAGPSVRRCRSVRSCS